MTFPVNKGHETPPIDSSWHQRRHQASALMSDGNPGAVSDGGGPDRVERTFACATVGCRARVPRDQLRHGPGGVYCARCHRVVDAVYHGGEVLVSALRDLRELEECMTISEPFPHGLPCMACSRGRAAEPGTLWCSPTCRRHLRTFAYRGFRLVCLGGIVLPERVWRCLRGLRESTYRTRRIQHGVMEALVAPLDAGRSRSARASVAARRGIPPADDGLELRDLIRSMAPKIRTFP